jgi:hypothetical protein
MALNLEDKKALVAEVAEVAAKAQSVVAAEYRGLTVGQMTELRSKARAQGVYMRRSSRWDRSSRGRSCSRSRRTIPAPPRAW